jgi:hypothetical protein
MLCFADRKSTCICRYPQSFATGEVILVEDNSGKRQRTSNHEPKTKRPISIEFDEIFLGANPYNIELRYNSFTGIIHEPQTIDGFRISQLQAEAFLVWVFHRAEQNNH